MNALMPKTGKLLIAMPNVGDPSFERSVILLCEHFETGSFGLILNQATNNLVSDVVDDINIEFPLYIGGPVEQNTLHFIHRLGYLLEDSIDIGNGIFWSGDFENLKTLINIGKVKENEIRFFLGYSGWGNGQLSEEINQKSWTLTDVDADFVFDKNANNFWREVLLKMGGTYKQVANYPIDPRLN